MGLMSTRTAGPCDWPNICNREATAPFAGKVYGAVVGAGLTGIEAASEMVDRLKTLLYSAKLTEIGRVILADHNSHVGSDFGRKRDAGHRTGTERIGRRNPHTGVAVAAVGPQGATLATGEAIEAATVIWCAGMRANPLTAKFPVEGDRFGRIPIDEFLKFGPSYVLAAGDSAWGQLDEQHVSVMSCQHGRPMGRFAGHNAVCDLLGQPLLPLHIDWYVTVLDLGCGRFVYQGWDRQVEAVGPQAKKTKQTINCRDPRIYPPLSGNRAQIFSGGRRASRAACPVRENLPTDLRREY